MTPTDVYLDHASGAKASRPQLDQAMRNLREPILQIDGKAVQFGEPKTKGSRRRIPVARSVMAEIDRHMAEFVGPRRMPCCSPHLRVDRSTFHRYVSTPAVRAAALEALRPHDLRHSFVSLLVAAGANVKQVSTWVSHSGVTVTLDTYTHVFRADGADVADRLHDLLTSGRARPAPISRIGTG